jgi:protein-tyrosine-phosphatase
MKPDRGMMDGGVVTGAPKRPGSVLFLCGMNAIRSPMAEAITKALYGNTIYVRSAGVRAGQSDPFMRQAMAERGLDPGDRIPVLLDELADSYFDLIVTLSPEAHHRALEVTRSQAVDIEYWPTLDPSTVAGNREQVLAAYREVSTALEKKIRDRFG